MFQKNLESIRQKNPDLADRLEKIDISTISDIEVLSAESNDPIISYKKMNLHSLTDPLREANTVWNRTVKRELGKNDIQVVFGLGLGYLFKRAYISAQSKIFVLEPFTEILRFVLEYVDLSAEIADKRVYITDNPDELLGKIQSEFLSGDKLEFLFLNPYIALTQDMLQKITGKTLEICEMKGLDQNTVFLNCKMRTKNFILNMSCSPDARPVNYFKDIYKDKAALIVSAGPSLASNIENIRNNKDKFIIIAVAPAFRTLVKEGIIPDFVTFCDASYLEDHIIGCEEYISKVNTVFEVRAQNSVFKKSAKCKLMYMPNVDSLSKWFVDLTNENIELLKSGGTVSILSYYLARYLGCNPIAFSGLDLAFIDNKIYATGKELEIDDQGYIKLDYDLTFKKLTYVKGNNGEMLPSRDDYALFIRQFEDIFAAENNPVKIINTSVFGARIEGMEYMQFDDLVRGLMPHNISVDQTLSDIAEKTERSWLEANTRLYKEFKNHYEQIKGINSEVDSIYWELVEICKMFDQESPQMNSIQMKIENMKSLIIDARDKIIKNQFLSTFLQGEIWEYTRSYKTSILPNINDIKHNMNTERQFFKMATWATSNTAEWLKEAIENYESSNLLVDQNSVLTQ